jgi:hypothetical protein
MQFDMSFRLFIFTNHKQTVTQYISPSILFTPTIINLGERDGDALLKKLESQIAAGEPVNALEVIYLPLYRSATKSVKEMTLEVVRMAPKVTAEQDKREKIILLTALVVNKFLNSGDYREIWEAVRMIYKDDKFLQAIIEVSQEEERVKLQKEIDELEAKRKEEEAKRKEEETKRKEEEAKRKEEETKRKEEHAIRKEKEERLYETETTLAFLINTIKQNGKAGEEILRQFNEKQPA